MTRRMGRGRRLERVSQCLVLVRQCLSALLLRISIQLSPRLGASGLHLADVGCRSGGSPAFAPVLVALERIRTASPRQFARVQRSFRWVVIVPGGNGGGQYLHCLRACLLDREYIATALPESLAATIVHESAHARIAAWGIPYARDLRGRVERICVDAEIAFLRRVPGTASLVAQAEHDLASEWWDSRSSRARRTKRLHRLWRS